MRPARSTQPERDPGGRGIHALARSLQAMAVFARVVETRSFTAAAHALGTTTSAVSRCVSRLEERLRVRLVQRTARSLGLTEAGRVFDGHCRRILRQVDEAELAVAQVGDGARRRSDEAAARGEAEDGGPADTGPL